MTLLDDWVLSLAPCHHDSRRLELRAARDLAKESRLGWYIEPTFSDWQIGKMTIGQPYLKFLIMRDDGSPLLFPSVKKALEFYRKELGVFGVAMFQA
jgi:hypothetical protein